MENQEGTKTPTAYLVDLVSNRKIPVSIPRCRVGRDDLNDIVISGDQSISRFHFIISYENGEFIVQDAKSRHGSFLNGNQLTTPEPIKDGDVLKVGVSLFWFVVENASAENVEEIAGEKVQAIEEVATAEDESETQLVGRRSLDSTQELLRPDQATLDKLEQAANAIRLEADAAEEVQQVGSPEKVEESKGSVAEAQAEKKTPVKADEKSAGKASLASLLQGTQDRDESEEEAKVAEEARLKAEEEAKVAEEARLKAEEEAKAAEEARLKAEEEARAAEEVRLKAEEEARAAEEVRLKAEEEARAAEEARLKAEEEARAEEARLKAEEEAKAAEEARLKAEEEAKAAEEARLKAEEETRAEEARLKAEEEAKAAEEARLKAEEEASMPSESPEDVIAKLKAQEQALLEELGSGSKEEKSFPEKVLNKPSDTMTLEALPAPSPEESLGLDEKKDAELDENTEIIANVPQGQGEANQAEREVVGQAVSPILSGDLLSGESSASEQSSQPSGQVETGAGNIDQVALVEVPTRAQTEAAVKEPVLSNSQLEVLELKLQTAGAKPVSEWTKKYFSDEIAILNKELDGLNEQVKLAQQKIKEVETRVACTRSLRNTLLTSSGDELVEACGKVLSLLGWSVSPCGEDNHELGLEHNEKDVSIARVIWTTSHAERSHLGQLSISQTRYWCEKGVEPKGILIVSKLSEQPPTSSLEGQEDAELADYAAKKNVCLMTTMQLLALYKEVALANADADALRQTVTNSSGWLQGHHLEPGTAEVVEPDSAPAASVAEPATNMLSSLLSS